jgi:hypothetical protein
MSALSFPKLPGDVKDLNLDLDLDLDLGGRKISSADMLRTARQPHLFGLLAAGWCESRQGPELGSGKAAFAARDSYR